MTRVPFHETALARYDEAQEASERLLASLDELRRRADNFLTVAASTTTMLATLARTDRYVVPSGDHKSSSEPRPPAPDSPTAGQTRPHGSGAVVPPCPTVRRAKAPYPDAQCEIHPPEAVVARAITSSLRVMAGTPFSFTVTTGGTPVPTITERGERPKHFLFWDNGDGTATLCGTPRKAGVYHVALKAKFGRGAVKYVVIQAFTLTVSPND
jgi:hypothetical protein